MKTKIFIIITIMLCMSFISTFAQDMYEYTRDTIYFDVEDDIRQYVDEIQSTIRNFRENNFDIYKLRQLHKMITKEKIIKDFYRYEFDMDYIDFMYSKNNNINFNTLEYFFSYKVIYLGDYKEFLKGKEGIKICSVDYVLDKAYNQQEMFHIDNKCIIRENSALKLVENKTVLTEKAFFSRKGK